MNRDLNTRLIDLTLADLGDFIAGYLKPEQPEKPAVKHRDDCVYGITGIAKLLGVSNTMVHEYRKRGWIEPAIKQCGRKIICNKTLALELFGKRN